MDGSRWATPVATPLLVLALGNLAAVLALGEWQALGSPDLWVPLSTAVTGWLVARAVSGNPVGWLLLAMGWSSGLFGASALLVLHGVDLAVAHWLTAWVFLPSYYLALLLLPLLFPTGAPPSAGWRPVVWAAGALLLVESLLLAFGTRESLEAGAGNPFAVEPVADLLARVEPVIWLSLPALALLGLGALAHRLRRAAGVERAQVLCMLVAAAVSVAWWLLMGSGLLLGLLLPSAVAVAVLRFRLYDVERALVRTLTYGGLALVAGAVYAGVVLLAGLLTEPDLRSQVVATVLAVLVVHPLRDRFARLSRRALHGVRHDEVAALTAAADRLADAPSPDRALEDLAAHLREVFGAAGAAVLPLGAPDPSTPSAPVVARAVRHQGEPVGTVLLWRADELSAQEHELLDRLVRQVGPALHAVGLTARLALSLEEARAATEELRASRIRITRAYDDARRRVERDLHDGAQQGLLALNVGLARLTPLVHGDGVARVEDLQQLAQRTLIELRRLASGTYPSALGELGVAAALREACTGVGVPVVVEDRWAGRPAPDVEAAVYFACLEAVVNAVKHAAASRVLVTLCADDDALGFEVRDDGRGMDPAAADRGTGLAGMADRMGAVGGSVSVLAGEPVGTRVVGRVPVSASTGTAAPPARVGAPAPPR